jgi:hypothetical protein
MATFSAVLVALFKDQFFRWLNRPVLKASLHPRPPDCAKALITVQNQAAQVLARVDCYYLRLWVENIGKGRAEQVQVYAANLFRRDEADGTFRRVDTFLPMNLLWAHSRPNQPEVFAQGISALMGRHCDLGYVVRPAQSEAFGAVHVDAVLGQCIFILDVEAPPGTGNHLLTRGSYRLELRVAAANAPRTTCFVRINLTGPWFDDEQKMFTQGIAVSME